MAARTPGALASRLGCARTDTLDRWGITRGRERNSRRLDRDRRARCVSTLLPFFARYAVADIDVALVERYREEKLIEREHSKLPQHPVTHSGQARASAKATE